MGIVGALVIAKWSWGLMRDTGATMLDYRGEDDPLKTKIRQVIAAEGDRITDLHVWQLGPGHHAVIVAVVTKARREPAVYRARFLDGVVIYHYIGRGSWWERRMYNGEIQR